MFGSRAVSGQHHFMSKRNLFELCRPVLSRVLSFFIFILKMDALQHFVSVVLYVTSCMWSPTDGQESPPKNEELNIFRAFSVSWIMRLLNCRLRFPLLCLTFVYTNTYFSRRKLADGTFCTDSRRGSEQQECGWRRRLSGS